MAQNVQPNIEQPVRDLYAALNQQDRDAFDRFVSESVEYVDYGQGETIRGREAFKDHFKNWWTAFPKGTGEIRNLLAIGDQVVIEVVGRGEQTGAFESSRGRVDPSNQPFQFHFCQVFRIKDGRIAYGHSYSDAYQLAEKASKAKKAA